MVQVDVFWSYGIGAGVAVAHAGLIQRSAAQYLRRTGVHPPARWIADERSYRDNLVFLATLFAPSGMFLLTAFPSWETMHVATSFSDLPAWLVTLFALTNITQGLLGYKLTELLIRSGRSYLGYLQWVAGYFGMFFILVHGWDGTGYQRFFSSHPSQLAGWSWSDAAAWVTSGVGLSLLAMGVVFIPALVGLMVRGLRQSRGGSIPALVAHVLGMNVVVMPLVAIAASACVHTLGWVAGPAVFAVVAWFGLLRPGAALHRHCEHLLAGEPPPRAAVAMSAA